MAGTACLLLLAPLAGASNEALYADGAADAPAAAPDLTSAQVSNDDAGNVVFRIAIPNRSALGRTDLVALLIDADRRKGTGCARGAAPITQPPSTLPSSPSESQPGRSRSYHRSTRSPRTPSSRLIWRNTS